MKKKKLEWACTSDVDWVWANTPDGSRFCTFVEDMWLFNVNLEKAFSPLPPADFAVRLMQRLARGGQVKYVPSSWESQPLDQSYEKEAMDEGDKRFKDAAKPKR